MSAIALPSLRIRRQGWESRLAEVIEAARSRPYQLGAHDCFRFACSAIEALTGLDLWAPWQGRYTTRREALRLLAGYGGTFTAAASRMFQAEPAPMGFARRGDIAEYVGPAGVDLAIEPHLVVVVGAQAAGLGEHGLYRIRRSSCAHVWRIG